VRNAWVHVLLAALALLIVAYFVLDRPPRGAGDALVGAAEEVPVAPLSRTEAVLLAPTARPDEPGADSDARSSRARVEAAPGGEVAPTEAPPAPEPEAPPSPPRPEAEEALFVLRILVRAEGGDVPSQWEDASVTARFSGTDADFTVLTPIGRTAVIEVPLKAASAIPGACDVVVSHPGYCLHRSTLDLSRLYREGRDAEERVRFGMQHFVMLRRYVTRVTGLANDADHAALVTFSDARLPELMEIVDIATVSDGSYSLRAPSTGEWLVVALRRDAHPMYALVDVPRHLEAGAIGQHFVTSKLRTLETQLRVDAIIPVGYDPTGLAVVLEPADHRFEASAREREDAPSKKEFKGLPALTWHRTSADAPGGEAWGVDLRRPEAQPQRRDSIVWMSSTASFDAYGAALVRGGATGPGLVQVQDPFDKERWEPGERRDFEPLDATSVALPVARLDVRAFDAEGPLTRGKAHVDWLSSKRVWRRGRAPSSAQEAQRSGFELDVPLDTAGCAALFVPSLATLSVIVLDESGARSALRRLNAPGPAGAFSVTLTVVAPQPSTFGDGVQRPGR
jgi:hypothetical protein